MRGWIVLLSVFLVFAGCGDDQDTTVIPPAESPTSGLVYGTVVDSGSQQPVPGVTLTLGEMQIITADDGAFAFEEVAFSDALALQAEAEGYELFLHEFSLEATQLQIGIELLAESNSLDELQTLLDNLQRDIESDDPQNIPAIESYFAEDYSVPMDDPATAFAIQFAPIPMNTEDIEPSMTELFETYDKIVFDFQDRQFDSPTATTGQVLLVLHLHTERGPRPDKTDLDVRCELRFRRDQEQWLITYWRLIELAQQEG